jgi:hypothetical protein
MGFCLLARAVCIGATSMATQSTFFSAEGGIRNSEWPQREAQVPLPGNTRRVDQNRCEGYTSTECTAHDGEPRYRAGKGQGRYQVISNLESEIFEVHAVRTSNTELGTFCKQCRTPCRT